MNDVVKSSPKKKNQLQYRGTECKNCKHPLDLSDKYCPNCSQANNIKKLTLKDFFDEFFANVISYDSKLLKTLTALLLKPGKITRDYIDGKRKTYTNPFRFLLSLAIIYFIIIDFTSDFSELDQLSNPENQEILTELNTINFDFNDHNQDPDQIIKTLDSLTNEPNIKKRIKKNNAKIEAIFTHPTKHFHSHTDSTLLNRFFHKHSFFKIAISKKKIFSYKKALSEYHINNTPENKYAYNTANSIAKLEQQPGSFINDLISKLPFTIFFFLPVFALFVWMIYIRKNYTYTDHIIFSFHNQSLLFILLILSYLFDAIFKTSSEGFFLLVFLIYLYKSMRNFYKERRVKTVLKYIFLNTIFFILASITIFIVLTGSIFTF